MNKDFTEAEVAMLRVSHFLFETLEKHYPFEQWLLIMEAFHGANKRQ